MGSVGAVTQAVVNEPPTFDTHLYKSTTQQMKDVVSEVLSDMQQDFPVLAKSVEFYFTNGGLSETIGDTIFLNGRGMKQQMKDDEYWRRELKKGDIANRVTIAHELMHVIQNRMSPKGGRGLDTYEAFATRILDNAIASYQASNPNAGTKEQIYKDLKKAYGFDWDRATTMEGRRSPNLERMAVAWQKAYEERIESARTGRHYNNDMVGVGRQLVEELRKEAKRRQ